ncbi:MAG: class II aldolase/adducin family protein [Clostridia bacterium]|nr:class II aldolase/adducin family protein [Clostridia bacterium]
MFIAEREARDLIVTIGRNMYMKGFVSANDGNMTVRVGENTVLVTPTGVSKGLLTPESLLTVSLEGTVLSGPGTPTSELAMHLNVYRADDAIMSTCHTHALHLTAYACAGIELAAPTTPAAVCVVGRLPVSPYHCSGSPALAASVIPYVRDFHGVNLGNHGPFTWGKSPIEAWYRMEAAESACELDMLLKHTIGKYNPLTMDQIRELVAFHHVDITEKGMCKARQGCV